METAPPVEGRRRRLRRAVRVPVGLRDVEGELGLVDVEATRHAEQDGECRNGPGETANPLARGAALTGCPLVPTHSTHSPPHNTTVPMDLPMADRPPSRRDGSAMDFIARRGP